MGDGPSVVTGVPSKESRGVNDRGLSGTEATERRPRQPAATPKAPPTASARCKPESEALPAELAAAESTRQHSVDVRESLRRDKCYWFAFLYYVITDQEIQRRGQFKYPAFVMHFIPVFYDMYGVNAEQYAKNGMKGLKSNWQGHFSFGGEPTDGIKNQTLFLSDASSVITSGVSTHILDDMPVALERAYRTYTATYCTNNRPFDDYKSDFIDAKSKELFVAVRTSFVNHLVNFGMGFGIARRGVNPEVAAKAADKLGLGINIDEIFAWRETAWQRAKERIEGETKGKGK